MSRIVGKPVSSLTLDEPHHVGAEDDDGDGGGGDGDTPLSQYDDPLRDPLLPRRRPRTEQTLRSRKRPSHRRTASSSSQQQQHQRVLDRDAAFYQSRGRWRIQHLSREATRFRYEATGQQRRLPLTKRVWDDWFYSLAYQKTFFLMTILFVSYGAIVVLFAFIYLGVSLLGEESKVNPDGSVSKLSFCDMDIHDHMEALYFSLSVRNLRKRVGGWVCYQGVTSESSPRRITRTTTSASQKFYFLVSSSRP